MGKRIFSRGLDKKSLPEKQSETKLKEVTAKRNSALDACK
jgi:hypothetical protein